MTTVTIKTSLAAFALCGLLAGCASPGGDARMAELEQRLDTLEDKTNRALQNAAAAKVDASTALLIATQDEEQ